jgi:hypothetical protein
LRLSQVAELAVQYDSIRTLQRDDFDPRIEAGLTCGEGKDLDRKVRQHGIAASQLILKTEVTQRRRRLSRQRGGLAVPAGGRYADDGLRPLVPLARSICARSDMRVVWPPSTATPAGADRESHR